MTQATRFTPLLPTLTALSFAFALFGCGGPGAAVEGESTTSAASSRPAWERTPIALLPRDAFLVAHIDGARVRRSPYFPFLENALRQASHDGRDSEGRALMSLLGSTDDLWVAVRSSSPESESVESTLVFRGPGVDAGMRLLITPDMRHETKGRAEIWQARGNDVLVRLDAKTWVALIDGGLPGLLARADGSAPGDPLGDARLRTTADRVGFSSGAPIAIVAHPPQHVRASFAREGFPASLLGDAEYIGARLDPSNGLVVDVTADMSSADAAARADDALHGILSSYASNPMVALMGLSDILRRIEVRSTGARIDVRASTTDEETRSLLERYGELLESAISTREVAPAMEPRSAARK